MKEITPDNRIEILYKLCKTIINLPLFEEICREQSTWINHAFKENKAPKKWTAEYFLNFSRNVMDLESFNPLFEQTQITKKY